MKELVNKQALECEQRNTDLERLNGSLQVDVAKQSILVEELQTMKEMLEGKVIEEQRIVETTSKELAM